MISKNIFVQSEWVEMDSLGESFLRYYYTFIQSVGSCEGSFILFSFHIQHFQLFSWFFALRMKPTNMSSGFHIYVHWNVKHVYTKFFSMCFIQFCTYHASWSYPIFRCILGKKTHSLNFKTSHRLKAKFFIHSLFFFQWVVKNHFSQLIPSTFFHSSSLKKFEWMMHELRSLKEGFSVCH